MTHTERIAVLVKEWLRNNPESTDPTTLPAPITSRQYLENRLREAYIDGAFAGYDLAIETAIALVRRTLREE